MRTQRTSKAVCHESWCPIPPKVEYSLSPLGARLGPILDAMQRWGLELHEASTGNGRSETRELALAGSA